jgi:hypothetical protein
MKSRMPTLCLTVASLSLLPEGSALVAQSGPAKDTMHACDLVSNADVEKVTGRRLQDPPGRLSTVQKTQSACDFWKAAIQVALFSTRLSQEHVNRALDGNGFDRTKHPVAGVGDSASIYFTPKGKGPEGFLVAYAGTRTVTVRVKMEPGQPSESAQPNAVGLAKLAVAKLR